MIPRYTALCLPAHLPPSHPACSPAPLAGDGTGACFDLETGELQCRLEGHSAAVLGAVLTRKGRCGCVGAVGGGDDVGCVCV